MSSITIAEQVLLLYGAFEVQTLHLQAISGTPFEDPQPRTVIFMLNQLYNVNGYNKELFIYLNNFTNIWLNTRILEFISNIFYVGNFAIIYIVIITLFLIKLNTEKNPYNFFWHNYFILIKSAWLYLLFVICFTTLKYSINMPRPYCSIKQDEFISPIDFMNSRCLSSFPSAHSGLVVLLSYLLWPYTNKLSKIILVIISITVFVSRITLAMHYPMDIIYSCLITISIIKIGNYIFSKLKNNYIEYLGKFIFKNLLKIK